MTRLEENTPTPPAQDADSIRATDEVNAQDVHQAPGSGDDSIPGSATPSIPAGPSVPSMDHDLPPSPTQGTEHGSAPPCLSPTAAAETRDAPPSYDTTSVDGTDSAFATQVEEGRAPTPPPLTRSAMADADEPPAECAPVVVIPSTPDGSDPGDMLPVSPLDPLASTLPPPLTDSSPSLQDAGDDGPRPPTVRWALGPPRLDTAVSTVSVDDLPTRQFFPETDSSEGLEELQEDDDDGDVFAFHRPSTATQAGSAPRKTGPDSDYPPFTGVNNINNSVFAHSMRYRPNARTATASSSTSERPRTSAGHVAGRFPTFGRRHHGSTQDTLATTATTSTDYDSHDSREQLSRADSRPARTSRLTTATTDDSYFGSDMTSRYSASRRSYGMTDLSGDMTIPDGRTTWGDGNGGEFKDSELGDDPVDEWINEDSPYAEVRASVSNIDDPAMPALTLRAWILGMFLCSITCAANTFFLFRNPSPRISVLVVQVAAYPLGKFIAWVMPIRDYTLPRWLGGMTFSLNPCPFNVKEHTIIVMMAGVSTSPAYGLYGLVATEKFYKRVMGVGFNMLYTISTQITGMSMAGVCRRVVVYPPSMLWPGVLVTTTNLNMLHAEATLGTGSMSRKRLFTIVSLCAFGYYFIPGFLFTALSYFSYPCWIAPNNKVVNQLFGVTSGLGMGILTFDWTQISWIGSPFTAPWWAQTNIAVGLVVFYWIIVPAMFYTNVWYTRYMPLSVIKPGDRFQLPYNVTRILTPEFTLNTTAYAEYSPVYLSAAFNMTYMLAFGMTTSILVYTGLTHGKLIWNVIRRMKGEADDIHIKLMAKYPEVPDWWYWGLFAVCFALGVVTVEVFGTNLPVWGYLISILLAFVYVVPTAIVYAMTNLTLSFNLLAELIPGYAFQGQPIPGLIFKTFAVQSLQEALTFAKDMKLGHYMKIPPRSMFIAQVSACALTSLVQIGIKEWIMATIPDLCADNQKDLLLCLNSKTTFTSTIVWSLIGPERLFSKGGIYNPQLWMLFIGAVTPVLLWFWVRKFPQSLLRNLNITLVFTVALFIPPANGVNVASFLIVGFIFQFYIRRRAFAWWSMYNYVLSAALDVGSILSAIAVFMVLGLPRANLSWWGNNVWKNTMDYKGQAFDDAPGGVFGPTTWKI